ncbi:cysteinyl-tRNA synthetase [Histomonas meleagridis]|uniref:cysteinyl-tRNA synthetase n=1 Tax=Histomonas meleagridis TaxID=135588 RepID=UPI00355A59E5|nr:cysteinyl-tRNA synthetase [Histomonas meleagridis]KAH0798849.1 cysteinyl-tRNA synthetase [Histomonas meleagridis]
MKNTGVSVYNTLTKNVSPIQIENGKPLRVYTCGPTVYSDSHLGHARTYVTLDMIRRILSEYFNIPLQWTMNITDIDDKIIDSFNQGKTGCSTIFEYSRNRENAFFKDMDSLNVRRPDSLLRVTEVIPQIIDFIKTLVEKGFAYEKAGSVYFDVQQYINSGFKYAELEAGSYSEENRQSDDLAELGKKNSADFALWKATKPGEPFWDSPWGKGRPGWHIECSTMSGIFFGDHFDIHCGGIDLRFPHHTNEIAQSQAKFGVDPWVRIWIHTGQLKINGEKMSKSLGNFKTISSSLETHDWRTLRMAFALVPWQKVLELTDGLIEHANSLLSKITNFLQNAEAIHSTGHATDVHEFNEVDNEFSLLLTKTSLDVESAFSNNFNIPQVLELISQLITSANSMKPNNGLILSSARFIKRIMNILGFTKDSCNLSESTASNLGAVAESLAHHRQEIRVPARSLLTDTKAIAQLLGVDIRKPRPDNDEEAQKRYDAIKLLDEHTKSILSLMDKQRDITLPALGIRLEDSNNGVTFKLCDPEDVEAKLKKQAQMKHAQEVKKQQQQQKGNKKQAVVVDPAVFFREQTDKYSEWDETGFPTKDAKGEPLSRGQINKLRKQQKLMQDRFNKANQSK